MRLTCPPGWITPCFLIALAGCGRQQGNGPAAETTDTKEKPAVSVAVVRPGRATLSSTIAQPGAIRAFEQTPVYTKIAGFVRQWNVDDGDKVDKGDLLAELWVPEMEVEVKQKSALVTQAKAEVEQAKQSLAAAEAALTSAEAKLREAEAARLRARAELKRADSQYQRLTRAGKNGVIDKELLDETRYGFEAAEAGVGEVEARVQSAVAARDESRSKRNKAEADVAVAESRLEVSRANEEHARTLLAYAEVRAPFGGVVTKRNVDTGAFVQAATGTKGEPLFVVAQTGVMRIFVEVPETDAAWVRKGDAAEVRVQALRGETFAGKVSRTSWSLDRTTRTLLVQIDLPNSGGRLRPGMYAYAGITVVRPRVLTLPATAVITEGEVTRGYVTYCYFVLDGKARKTPIEVGFRDGQKVEVLRKQARPARPSQPAVWEEFTGHEQVIRDNVAAVTDGMRIPPTEE